MSKLKSGLGILASSCVISIIGTSNAVQNYDFIFTTVGLLGLTIGTVLSVVAIKEKSGW